MTLARHHRTLLAGAAMLAVLFGSGGLRYGDRGFGSPQMIADLVGGNAVLGILAVGMTFVILSGGIDLSVGAVMSLCSVLTAVLIARHQWHPFPAFACAAATGLAFGALMGAAIHVLGMKPFIVTLAGMFLARGLGFLVHLEPLAIGGDAFEAIAGWRVSIGDAALPLVAFLFAIILAAAAWVLRYHPFGRAVYALGGDEEAALLMGLPVGRVRIAIYAVSGLCSGIGGVALAIYLSAGSHAEGVGMELDAIAAVVIGGTLLSGGVGSVFGTLIGVLIIGAILNIMTYEDFSSGLTRVMIGALLLAVVLVQRMLMRGCADTR